MASKKPCPGCQARAGTYALVWMGQSNPSNKD